jgi:hypothetical protein
MTPKISVPQAISDIATEKLHTLGDVTIWPGTDGPMPNEEIIAAVSDIDICMHVARWSSTTIKANDAV